MSALVVISGIFFSKEGSIFVNSETGDVSLSRFLLPYLGRECEVSLHHLPTNPVLPGCGTCLSGPHCPFHSENPGKILELNSHGVLSMEGPTARLGDLVLPMVHMEGHYGRMIVFSPPEVCIGESPIEDLLKSSEELSSLLTNLKGIL